MDLCLCCVVFVCDFVCLWFVGLCVCVDLNDYVLFGLIEFVEFDLLSQLIGFIWIWLILWFVACGIWLVVYFGYLCVECCVCCVFVCVFVCFDVFVCACVIDLCLYDCLSVCVF